MRKDTTYICILQIFPDFFVENVEKCKKMQKYFGISKKSSTFARFFARITLRGTDF